MTEPETGSQTIPGGFGSQLSEAVTVQETACEPVTTISAGHVIAGASMSVTVIMNWQSACPPGPLAEQVTTVSPTPTEFPEGGSQVTEVAQVEDGAKLVRVPQRPLEEPLLVFAGQVIVGSHRCADAGPVSGTGVSGCTGVAIITGNAWVGDRRSRPTHRPGRSTGSRDRRERRSLRRNSSHRRGCNRRAPSRVQQRSQSAQHFSRPYRRSAHHDSRFLRRLSRCRGTPASDRNSHQRNIRRRSTGPRHHNIRDRTAFRRREHSNRLHTEGFQRDNRPPVRYCIGPNRNSGSRPGIGFDLDRAGEERGDDELRRASTSLSGRRVVAATPPRPINPRSRERREVPEASDRVSWSNRLPSTRLLLASTRARI